MRTMLVVAMVGLSVGCTGRAVSFSRDGGIDADANGVAMVQPGLAQVGMNTTTCEVTTSTGGIGTDYNYPGDSDKVQDVGEDANGDVVVVVTSEKGVHVQKQDEWFWASSEDYDVPDATDAVIVNDEGDVAVLSKGGGCTLERVQSGDAVDLGVEVCQGSPGITADPTRDSVYVAGSTGVIKVQPGVAPQPVSDEPSELADYDKAADALYVAGLGDTVLRALEADGTLRWQVDVGAPIRDVTALGDRGLAVVSVAFSDGSGALRSYDGFTGELVSDQGLFNAADELYADERGNALATVRPGQVDFFSVSNPWADVAEVLLEGSDVSVDW